jgi:hypothetical protein
VGLPAVFTGFLHGDALSRAIASCDVKVFPSTTDTWGNAPLEAQACGLPVIVSDVGGPRELMEPGVTGFAIQGRDPDELVGAMERLTSASARARMGAAARAFAVEHQVHEPFTAVFDSDRYRARLAEAKAGSRGTVALATFDLSSPSFPLVVGGSLPTLAAGGEA